VDDELDDEDELEVDDAAAAEDREAVGLAAWSICISDMDTDLPS
jgi:hypothetical protein